MIELDHPLDHLNVATRQMISRNSLVFQNLLDRKADVRFADFKPSQDSNVITGAWYCRFDVLDIDNSVHHMMINVPITLYKEDVVDSPSVIYSMLDARIKDALRTFNERMLEIEESCRVEDTTIIAVNWAPDYIREFKFLEDPFTVWVRKTRREHEQNLARGGEVQEVGQTAEENGR